MCSPGIEVATGCPCSQGLMFEGGNVPTVISSGSSAVEKIQSGHYLIGHIDFSPNRYGLSARPWPPFKCIAEKRQQIFFSHPASSFIYYLT